jgi:hypothetical protein
MLVTALGATSRMTANITGEPAELTSAVSKLASLLNYTESTFGSSLLPTLSTVFNWTRILDDTTDHNYMMLTDMDVLTNDSSLSSETFEEFYDDLVNRTTGYLSEGNISFGDQLINASSPVNIGDTEEDFLNSSDDRCLNMLSSDTTKYFDMTNNTSFLSMKNTTFDIPDTDLDQNSGNLSSEQHLGSFLSTERTPPSDSVTAAYSSLGDGNVRSTSPRESEHERLMSTLITTITSLLAQNGEVSEISEHIKQVSQTLQRGTTDPTSCYSAQCNTAPTDGTADTWEPPVTVSTESAVTARKPSRKYNIDVFTVILTKDPTLSRQSAHS